MKMFKSDLLDNIVQGYATYVMYMVFPDYLKEGISLKSPKELKWHLRDRLLFCDTREEADRLISNVLENADFDKIYNNLLFFSPVIQPHEFSTAWKRAQIANHEKNEAVFKLYEDFIPDLEKVLDMAKNAYTKDEKGFKYLHKADIAMNLEDIQLKLSEILQHIHNSEGLTYNEKD